MSMKQLFVLLALGTCIVSFRPAIASGADYKAPLPYTAMYDQLTIGMSRRQAYEITKAPELQQEPADLETTDLLRLEPGNRHCRAQLLRLHWYRDALHWVEYFQLDPAAGVTYEERGHPDPIGEGVVKRLSDTASLYASHWEELTASIAHEGSPTLQARTKQMTDRLKHKLEELRHGKPQ